MIHFYSLELSIKTTYQSDSYTFLFILTKIYNLEPTKFLNLDTNKNICHGKKSGRSFGRNYADLAIYENFSKAQSYSNFPAKYKHILGKGRSIFTDDLNNNDEHINIKEIEIFKICN